MPDTHTSPKVGRLKRLANALGCQTVLLDSEVNASQLEYLDLVPAKTGALLLPDAVAEFQGDRYCIWSTTPLKQANRRCKSRRFKDCKHCSRTAANMPAWA